MLDRVLTGQQEVLLSEERGVLIDLLKSLARAQASPEDLELLERSVRTLDELFLLVVVGEFNSGKSTFINALLGRELLEEGVTPTTRRIHRLAFADAEKRSTGADGIEEIGAPVELLRQVRIVDTPGTNALERHHEAITREFAPRSDLVLFVTSADRPFTESERAFIEAIREWGKKLVLVLNKIDFLPGESERAEVIAFIEENAQRLLGFVPEIFPVSARAALAAKRERAGAGALATSGFAALETYLAETLDEAERVRLKLLNPLGVGRRLASRYLELAGERAELLRDDFQALEEIDSQLTVYREDLAAQFRFRLSDVDNELHGFESRGKEFFDDTLRLPRALDLLNKARVQAEFERQVIRDTPRRLESKVEAIIDWMVEAELEQWQTASRHLARRRTEAASAAGELGAFDLNRGRLLETVGRTAQRTIRSYDQRAEAARLAESVKTAVAGAAILEAGAVGLGTAITVLATTTAADVTGLIAAGTLATLGLFILPARRRKAKRDLARKILQLRQRLMGSLTEQFDREIEASAQRIRDAFSPYTRFVRAERSRLEEIQASLGAARDNLERLRQLIEGL